MGKPLTNAFLPLMGMMAGGILFYSYAVQKKKDDRAYRDYMADVRVHVPKGDIAGDAIWNAALSYVRKEDNNLLAQRDAAVRTLKRVAKLADVIEAQPKLERMMRDPEPDQEVKRAILEYWARKLEEALYLDMDPYMVARSRMRMIVMFKHELDELYAAKAKLERIEAAMEG